MHLICNTKGTTISKKIFWFPMLLKKIFWFWWRKKNNLIQSNVKFWKNISRWARQKKINILTLVLSEKKFWTKQKSITPPLQVKWSVPNYSKYIDESCGWTIPYKIVWSKLITGGITNMHTSIVIVISQVDANPSTILLSK